MRIYNNTQESIYFIKILRYNSQYVACRQERTKAKLPQSSVKPWESVSGVPPPPAHTPAVGLSSEATSSRKPSSSHWVGSTWSLPI